MAQLVLIDRAPYGFRLENLFILQCCPFQQLPESERKALDEEGHVIFALMGTFADTANVDYRLSLPTKENKLPFYVFR